MAKFISRIRSYRVLGIRAPMMVLTEVNGVAHIVQRPDSPAPIDVEFVQGVESTADKEIGIAYFMAHARYQEDGSLRVPGSGSAGGSPMVVPIYRGGQVVGATDIYRMENEFSWFDTDIHLPGGADRADEDAELVTHALRSVPDFGVDFFEVLEERIAAPIPGYDGITLKNMTALIKVADYNPHVLAAYELQNLARPEFLELYEQKALEAITDAVDDAALAGSL